ncbi:hypothetical protein AB0M28_07285 [Streptomyces sp. NPDC051940]|uniref:hypothetical protein n=1 Tax=Streptomyces sp. NPDC051940 TaxID=3155675 RepID=UPI00343E7CB5
MRRTSGRRQHALRTAAVASLCALVLAGCGTKGADDGKAGGRGQVAAEPAADPGEGGGDAEFIDFMQMLVDVAGPCVADPPTPDDEEETGAPHAPTASPPELEPADEAPPSTDALAPRDPAVELSDAEKCAAARHTARVDKALAGTPDPSRTQVADALRRLGYIDERVEVPQLPAGGGVDFTLDLRVMGGALCLDGHVAAGRTTGTPYGAVAEVPCAGSRAVH